MEMQLKEMESKLLSAVAASSAIQVSQVRAAAIRTMSEELKTTLGIIKGYVSSALGSTQSGISEKQQEFLGMVINRSARLEKFINDLVDIYQVEIEQANAQYEEVNLASEIEGLAFNFQAQADVKNIKMKVEAKGTVPKVPVVRRRFTQLWNILYLQIIKDAPRGSSIPITVESIGENVKVTVQDPGLVVVPESLPRLFDEFYDPKHPASTQLAGTGLKFALLKTILAAHGGGAPEKGGPWNQADPDLPDQDQKTGGSSGSFRGFDGPRRSGDKAGAFHRGIARHSTRATRHRAGFGHLEARGSAPGSSQTIGPGPGSQTGDHSRGFKLRIPPYFQAFRPVTAPGIKPPPMAPAAPPPPAPGAPPPPSPTPGLGIRPPMLASPAAPGLKPPSATSGLLDSLMEKKPAPPSPGGPAIPAAPSLGVSPKPPIPIPGDAGGFRTWNRPETSGSGSSAHVRGTSHGPQARRSRQCLEFQAWPRHPWFGPKTTGARRSNGRPRGAFKGYSPTNLKPNMRRRRVSLIWITSTE